MPIENVIKELEFDLRKTLKTKNGNDYKNIIKSKLKLNLFQFLKIKNLYNRKRPCIGCIYYRNKKGTIIEHGVPEYVNLVTRGVLQEVKNENINYYFELLLQYYSKEYLQRLFLSKITEDERELLKNKNFYDLFCWLRNSHPSIITGANNFRFYTLAEKYEKYESEIYEWLSERFDYMVNLKIQRG